MKKKIIMGCVAAIVVFGMLSYGLTQYQAEAKKNWTEFLAHKGVEMELIQRYAALTRAQMAALDGKVGAADLSVKEALWDRYRTYDYWLSVTRSIAAIAIAILIITALKNVLSKITVSESFYHKFYLPPVQEGVDRKEPEKGDIEP